MSKFRKQYNLKLENLKLNKKIFDSSMDNKNITLKLYSPKDYTNIQQIKEE